MGKQKGESARSKNRPSSSSFAASLLPQGSPAFGFGGYIGTSRVDVSSSSEAAALSLDMDSEVAQHLKRLGRKDSTTKLKALASLCELFEQKSGDDIIQSIPQWAFEYKRLLTDYSREVRRATHDAMTGLAVSVRKGLAPHLRSLMGPWWFSQFDSIPDVAQAAKKSFEAAFPTPERRLDVLVFCINDIFVYLNDNLRLTPEAMSDKSLPIEELQEMHQRVISSSLLAIAALIVILIEKTTQDNGYENLNIEQKLSIKAKITTRSSAEKIFSLHNYFLEFMKSKDSRVRSATYSVLATYVKHLPELFNEENMKLLSAAILGSFQERDVSCHSSMWDMILLFSRNFPKGWSYCNIQKVILNRLWNFLRNGCFGSQQVTYPVLVLFLDSVPAELLTGEKFVLSFLQNLWSGRNPTHVLPFESLAFFKAFKECFLWILHNASRFSMNERNLLSNSLISDILVTLLWHDFLLLLAESPEKSTKISSDLTMIHNLFLKERRSRGSLNISYPSSYSEDLGKCIIEILSEIWTNENHDLLNAFFATFQKDCLDILQQGECSPLFEVHLQRIMDFFLLFDQCEVLKHEEWPLRYLVGPLVRESIEMIQTLDFPDAVRLMVLLVEVCGPVTITSFIRPHKEEQCNDEAIYEMENVKKTAHFLQVFKEVFIPWCMDGEGRSNCQKLDLLIALIHKETFLEQWSSILSYASNNYYPESDSRASNNKKLALHLTMLMKKIREKINSQWLGIEDKYGSDAKCWQNELLDKIAISAACNSPNVYTAPLLCSFLGGSTEDDQICFLSNGAAIVVLQSILKNLVLLLSTSSFKWARQSCPILLPSCTVEMNISSISCLYRMSHFAFEVLQGSIFCLKQFEDVGQLVSAILASTFVVKWECSMASLVFSGGNPDRICNGVSLETSFDSECGFFDDKLNYKLKFSHDFQDFCFGLRVLLRGLKPSTMSDLKSFLVQTVWLAVVEDNDESEAISQLCCKWVLNMFELLCHSSEEFQAMLDHLLSPNEYWPLWTHPDSMQPAAALTGVDEPRYQKFVSFLDQLICHFGVKNIIAGFDVDSQIPSEIVSAPYSRAWIAVELLCTWKWQHHSVLDSFLSSLCQYVENATSGAEKNVIFSIIFLLLDGACLHGSCSSWLYYNTWSPSFEEVTKIESPYVRSLVSILLNVFIKNSTWGKQEAIAIFKHLVDQLYSGSALNLGCLRTLPFVMSVLIHLLLPKSSLLCNFKEVEVESSEEVLVQKNIIRWLEISLTFRPLCDGMADQGLEEWLQVLVSCYPLKIEGRVGEFKIELMRDISLLEKSSLLNLFRRQNCNHNSTPCKEAPAPVQSNYVVPYSTQSQMTLSKLNAIALGYCWWDFGENDWNAILSQSKQWIKSIVLVVEEIADNTNEFAMNITDNNKYKFSIESLKQITEILDLSTASISMTSLIILRLSSQIFELAQYQIETMQWLPQMTWSQIKDDIYGDVLRLFFASAVAEAIASLCCDEAACVISSSRLVHSQFWDLVALFVINSPQHVRSTAVEAMTLWGLCKGPVDALYAILFSSKPMPSLQLAAYVLLTTEPICHSSVFKVNHAVSNFVDEDLDLSNVQLPSKDLVLLRDEISCVLLMLPTQLLEMELVSNDRVNVFLAWALLLSFLHKLPYFSSTRETLVHYLQESVSSTILDCLFQYIPLKLGAANQRNKDNELVVEASKAADAAKSAITSRSLLFSIETLWPVGIEQMTVLSGSLYGFMTCLMPAFVRNWFANICIRSFSSAIESFTKAWCSPSLISDELSQVKETVVSADNFTVSVNKSALEIVAAYKKEEAGMDLVIRLPSSYPLRPVDVECTESLGISEAKQSKWLRTLSAFVRSQNGAIAEAIRIWNNNFDKEFQGVEACPICFSILHSTDHKRPGLACKTCKNKFHSPCLYKWFSTSHKSTCPLCQTPF